MLKNYLLIAIRNLKKDRIFSFINILGLACSLLILLWIQDERSMDKFNKNTSRLFSVYERQYYDNKVDAFHSTPGVLADEMKRVLPQVQYASGMAWENPSTFQVGEKIMQETGNHAGMVDVCAGGDCSHSDYFIYGELPGAESGSCQSGEKPAYGVGPGTPETFIMT
ncbi:MAG TPA: hypothetical protein VGM24_01490 [Puia sp.]|jgi:hypothetical protein